MKRTDYCWILLAGIVCLGAFLFAENAINGSIFCGFPLDDSWIHAQFAHNLAVGNGMSYSDNIQTPGDTSPLWVVLIAGIFKIFGESHAVLEIRLLSGVAYLVTGIITAAVTYKTTGKRYLGVLAGIIVVTISDMVWAGSAGMETSFFSMMLIAAYWSHLNDKSRIPIRTSILFALTSLTRPEGILLFVFAILDAVLEERVGGGFIAWGKAAVKRTIGQWQAILVFLAISIPFTIFCWKTTGRMFPNTYYSKGGGFHLISPIYTYIVYFYSVFLSANPVMFLLVCVGIYGMLKNSAKYPKKYCLYFFFLFPIIGTVASTTVLTRRLFFTFLPLIVPVAMTGIDTIMNMASNGLVKRRIQIVATVTMVLYSIIMMTIGVYPLHYFNGKVWDEAEYFAWGVHNINEQQVRIANWLNTHASPGAVVAANDVGAIGFLSHCRVIDVCGLVSNDVTDVIKKYAQFDDAKPHILEYLKATVKPDYVVMYEEWFPDWARQLPATDTFEVIAHNNVVCGNDTMTVMKMDWSHNPPIVERQNVSCDSIPQKRL